jgi:hypothetical protein
MMVLEVVRVETRRILGLVRSRRRLLRQRLMKMVACWRK